MHLSPCYTRPYSKYSCELQANKLKYFVQCNKGDNMELIASWKYWGLCISAVKELHHKKAVTLLFGVRRSRLGPIQSQAVLKRPEWRASAKLAESPVMIIKSVFLIWVWAISQRKIYALCQLCQRRLNLFKTGLIL